MRKIIKTNVETPMLNKTQKHPTLISHNHDMIV